MRSSLRKTAAPFLPAAWADAVCSSALLILGMCFVCVQHRDDADQIVQGQSPSIAALTVRRACNGRLRAAASRVVRSLSFVEQNGASAHAGRAKLLTLTQLRSRCFGVSQIRMRRCNSHCTGIPRTTRSPGDLGPLAQHGAEPVASPSSRATLSSLPHQERL